jgi:formylglycine-generating enzyme
VTPTKRKTKAPALFSPRWAGGDSSCVKDRRGYQAAFVFRDVVFSFRWIRPGEFVMGAPEAEIEIGGSPAEGPRHRVRISSGFWLGRTQVTQAQWATLVPTNPSKFKSPQYPVCGCSWHMARDFCDRLNRENPLLRCRLPTEAEWEYACRAGTTSAYNDGSECIGFKRDTPALQKLAIYKASSRGEWDAEHKPGEVASKRPNKWGLYDMHGNVSEWCCDQFVPFTGEDRVDPVNVSGTLGRGARGGNYESWAYECRSAKRTAYDADYTLDVLGFRLLLGDSGADGAT